MLKSYTPGKLLLGLDFAEIETLRQSPFRGHIRIKAGEVGQSAETYLVSGRTRHEIRGVFAGNGIRPGRMPMGERPVWHAKAGGRLIVALTLGELSLLQERPREQRFDVVGRYIHIDFDFTIFSGETIAAMQRFAESMLVPQPQSTKAV